MLRTVPEWIDQLETRSKQFSIAAVRFAKLLEIGRQIPRSVVWQFVDAATAVGANHRAARRARSKRELLSKLSIVAEEADECVFWLELIAAVSDASADDLAKLKSEASELRAIFASGAATLRASLRSSNGNALPRRPAVEN